MEIEIIQIPELKLGEQSLLDMHSLLNVLNVLQGEAMLIGLHLADDSELLSETLAVCNRVKASFSDRGLALKFAGNIRGEEDVIMEEVRLARSRYPQTGDDAETLESLANLQSVFHILEVRSQEMLARAREPDKWLDLQIEDMRADFLAVFSAIEKNSKGRYRIIYNLALQKSADYYVDFVIESSNGNTVAMPLIFKDVMRDLIANARKYTQPGGTINVGLHETATELRFVVQDTGCGIPVDELREVVNFGQRGSNVEHMRTMGGGFGLTKAFLVTKQFGGRFWIKSEVGIGTRVTIVIPRPAAL
ncbi:MAG: ATP-binding protein [Opitutaceae bacterium]|jgi:signal transduction histidine kinase